MKLLFASILFLALTPLVLGHTFLDFGTGNIIGSVTGVSDSNSNVSGTALGAGVSFDLTITAKSVTTPTLALSDHPHGIGVSGGCNLEIDNRNDLDPNDDESIVFMLSNATGLPAGQSLRISAIDTRAISSVAREYTLFDGASTTSGSFTTSPFSIPVANLSSVTLTAVGPTSGTALNSRFIVDGLHLSIVSQNVSANPATKVNHSEVNGSRNPFVTFATVAGKSYEVQGSTDDITWTPVATLSGMGASMTYPDEFTDASIRPRKFYRVRTVQTPSGNLTNTTLSITQTWPQQPGGFTRTAAVLVPASAGPHPVVIMLHGAGGNSSFINYMNPYLNNVIRVAPNGYQNGWNIDGTGDKAPDVAFIRDLIALIKTYDNVDAGRISILGYSNGSGLTNRLIIELDGAAFQSASCIASQMLTKMHNNGSFWYNASGNNNYDQIILPATGRRIIAIGGTADPVIPYTGGNAVGTTFMPSQESNYRFAQAMGETGPQLADAAGVVGTGTNGHAAPFVKYSYRSGQVIHYKLIGGDHGLEVSGSSVYATEAKQIIAAFLLQ